MSRLDRFILRLETQRRLLDIACAEVSAGSTPDDGMIVELGLGNGRTFHHCRERLPGYRIVGFERLLVAHPSSMPTAGNLILGEIDQTVPAFCAGDSTRAVLVHADLGDGTEGYDTVLMRWLPEAVVALCRPAAIVLSSTRLSHPGLLPVPIEGLVYEYWRYRMVEGAR